MNWIKKSVNKEFNFFVIPEDNTRLNEKIQMSWEFHCVGLILFYEKVIRYRTISQSAYCISGESVSKVGNNFEAYTFSENIHSNIIVKLGIQLKWALNVKDQLAGISFTDNFVESTMLRHDMHVGTVKIFSGGNDKESCTTLCNFFLTRHKNGDQLLLECIVESCRLPKEGRFRFLYNRNENPMFNRYISRLDVSI